MPQKKNPDIAELTRGKTGRIYGNLISLLTMMKSLPMAYNKDMQEDKPALFDSVDTVKAVIPVFCSMLNAMKFDCGRMYAAAGEGFTNATDLADYLVSRGMPFRSAHEVTGRIVSFCIGRNIPLEQLTLAEFKSFSDLIGDDVFDAISLSACVAKRDTKGGPSRTAVSSHIKFSREWLSKL